MQVHESGIDPDEHFLTLCQKAGTDLRNQQLGDSDYKCQVTMTPGTYSHCPLIVYIEPVILRNTPWWS